GLVLPGDIARPGVESVEVVAAEAAAEEDLAVHDGGRGQGPAAGDGDFPTLDPAVAAGERGRGIDVGQLAPEVGVDLHKGALPSEVMGPWVMNPPFLIRGAAGRISRRGSRLRLSAAPPGGSSRRRARPGPATRRGGCRRGWFAARSGGPGRRA